MHTTINSGGAERRRRRRNPKKEGKDFRLNCCRNGVFFSFVYEFDFLCFRDAKRGLHGDGDGGGGERGAGIGELDDGGGIRREVQGEHGGVPDGGGGDGDGDGERIEPAHISHHQVHQLRCAAEEQYPLLPPRRFLLQLPPRRSGQPLHPRLQRHYSMQGLGDIVSLSLSLSPLQ